jgi:hypothetical protein
MSLDFHTRNVKDKAACWDKDGKATGTLEVLVWTSLQIGLGDITKKNLPEWRYRIAVMHKLGSGIMVCPKPKSEEAAFEATLDALPTFIGLHTNVGNETRAWFFKKVKDMIETYARFAVEQYEEQAKKKATA